MRILIALFIGSLAAALAGCNEVSLPDNDNGGSGADSEDEAPALMSVMMSDLPAEEVSKVITSVHRIELIGDQAETTLFEGEATIDLMRMSSVYELMAIDRVKPGDYDRLRLHVSDFTLVSYDDNGEPLETTVSVPSGAIEVMIEGELTVESGDVLTVYLEFDLRTSLALMFELEGEWHFKPVIIVDLDPVATHTPIARIHGRLESVAAFGYRLCDTQLVSRVSETTRDLEACIEVALDSRTTYFGAEGLPVDAGMIEAGDEVTVVGRLAPRLSDLPSIPYGHLPPPGECRLWFPDRPDGQQPPPQHCETLLEQPIPENAIPVNDQGLPIIDVFGLNALVVEAGGLGTYHRLSGQAVSAVVNDQFDLDVSQGLVSDGTVLAQLYPESRLFDTGGVERDTDSIQPGTPVHLDSVSVLSDSEPDVLRTAFVQVDLDETPEARLEGVVLMVDVDGEVIDLATDEGDRCVSIADADLYEVTMVDGTWVTDRIEAGALSADQPVTAFGSDDTGGCFMADILVAEG